MIPHDQSEGSLDVLGFKIYYRSFGDSTKGGTILTLHGGPGATHDYMLAFTDLTKIGYRVVFYDMLGCGKSEVPDDVSLFSIEHWVKEAEGIREALGLGKIHLIGHSWGACVGLAYALKYQDSPRSLVVSSGYASTPLVASEIQRLKSELPANFLASIREAEETRDFKNPAYRLAVKEYMDRHYSRGLLENNPAEHQYTLMHVNKTMYRTLWGPNEFTIVGKLRDWDISDQLHKLEIPCLITVGRYDEVTPRVAKELQNQINASNLVVFEDSSHLAFLEEREKYMKIVADFLSQIP